MLSQDKSEDEEQNESKTRKGKSIKRENMENMNTSEDNNYKHLSRKLLIPTNKSPFNVYNKEELLSVLRNAIAFHRLDCGAKLMHALSLDLRTPHFVIMRTAFILFTQDIHNCDNNNSILTQIMKKISKYDINRREIMLEMIINYIKNNNRIAAKEYIESNQTFIKSNIYRTQPIIDTYLKCYVCYVDYMEWKELVNESIHSIYYRSSDSNKIIADKTKLSLKNIITQSEVKDCRLDIFVLIVLEMYEYDQQYEDAIKLLELYVHQNSHYLIAYIYLYNFCVKYPDYTTAQQLLYALKNICRLSPENILVLELVNKNVLSVEENFELIMEFIDYKANAYNLDAWTQLRDIINNVGNKKTTQTILSKWRERYKCYWLAIHFNVSQINFNENSKQLILCKQKVISFFESSTHKYVLETNKLLKKMSK